MFEHCMRIRVFRGVDKDEPVFEEIIVASEHKRLKKWGEYVFKVIRKGLGVPQYPYTIHKAKSIVSAMIKGNGWLPWYTGKVEISLGHLVDGEFTRFSYDKELIINDDNYNYVFKSFRYSKDRLGFWFKKFSNEFFEVMFGAPVPKDEYTINLGNVLDGDTNYSDIGRFSAKSRDISDNVLTDESVVKFTGMGEDTLYFSNKVRIVMTTTLNMSAWIYFHNKFKVGTEFTLGALKNLTNTDSSLDIVDVNGNEHSLSFSSDGIYWMRLDYFENDISILRRRIDFSKSCYDVLSKVITSI